MASFAESLALAVDLAVSAYCIQLHWKDCKTISNIKAAPTVDVGPELSSLIDTHPSASLPYAVIRGCVRETEGIVESSRGIPGVIRIETVYEVTPKRFGDYWDAVDTAPPVNATRTSVAFCLRPLTNSATSPEMLVMVDNPFDSIWENLLLPSSSYFTPSNYAVNSTAMGAVGNTKVLGVRKTEDFLPIGTIVTGIGSIITDSKTGLLKIQEPLDKGGSFPYILTTLSRDDFIRKLELKRNFHRVILGMALTYGIYLIVPMVRSWWTRFKLRRLRDYLVRGRENINVDDLHPCQICLVCSAKPREVILLNCGHVCVCADCLLRLNGQCPVCRERIAATHKAYIA